MCYRDLFPLGCPVRKVSGPEWQGVVVGYYSSSFTPGLAKHGKPPSVETYILVMHWLSARTETQP